MTNIAQRIEQLRMQKCLSRPALAAALALPRTTIEKFETGRQTPSQEQQQKLAAFFGVSVAYLQGGDEDGGMTAWLSQVSEEERSAPAPAPKAERPAVVAHAGAKGDGAVFSALLKSDAFQALVRQSVQDVLRSPEGQELLRRAVRRELEK